MVDAQSEVYRELAGILEDMMKNETRPGVYGVTFVINRRGEYGRVQEIRKQDSQPRKSATTWGNRN